jgi:hypothetical protein
LNWFEIFISATSISVSNDHDKQRIVLVHSGEINKAYAIDAYDQIFNANGFDPSYDAIIDYSGLTHVNLSFSGLKFLSEHFNSIDVRTGNNAFVVGNDRGRLSFAKLYTTVRNLIPRNKSRYKALKSIADAEIWLQSRRQKTSLSGSDHSFRHK